MPMIFHLIRFTPHLLVYLLMKERILKDLLRWMEVISAIPYHSRIKAYLWLLINVKEYRTLLYYRLGKVGRLLAIFASPMPTCFLTGVAPDKLGDGVVIQHGHSMRLGAERVGRDLQIWHNVTVGKSKSGGRKPRIGDNVMIYTGAIVLGDIEIGNNVKIGAATLVLKSVPDDCVVVGNPARIVRRHGVPCNELL